MKNIKIKKWQKYPEKKVLLLFNYVPIFGWIYFVFDYIPGVPILECDFMGLDYFKMIMKDANVIRALKNTFIFAGISIILTPLPMIFAILLNEIKSGPVRKFVQTFTTLPNFISWVIIFSLAFSLFSTDGLLTSVITKITGAEQAQSILSSKGSVYWFQTFLAQWKTLGWNSIIYLAAIAGIDQQQYEAAKVDGAGYLTVFTKLILPLSKPIIATVAVFVAVGQWNSWFDNHIYTRGNNSLTTLQYLLYNYLNEVQRLANQIKNTTNAAGMNQLVSNSISPKGIRMTITVLASLPIFMVYPFMQKYFVKGIMVGAVKG